MGQREVLTEWPLPVSGAERCESGCREGEDSGREGRLADKATEGESAWERGCAGTGSSWHRGREHAVGRLE